MICTWTRRSWRATAPTIRWALGVLQVGITPPRRAIVPSMEPIGAPDASVRLRFVGPETFARLPRLEDVPRAHVAILGVPFDSGVSYRPGARFGPAAIRAGSKLLRPYHPALDVLPWSLAQVADAGDLAPNPFDIVEAIAQIEAGAKETLKKADRVIALGGDHTIALPLLRVARERHGPIALVHFDAHLDTWNTYMGAAYTHGTPFRRAFEEGLLAADRCAHVGIRGSLYGTHDLDDDASFGFDIVSTVDIARAGVDTAVERIRGRVGDSPVYVSIDIDVLDPAHAPGTGTPEPGGLTTREVMLILRGMAGLPIVGVDVVEVAPAYDHAELTALAGANLAYECLALMALADGVPRATPNRS
jgi:agmatinase